MSGSVSNLRFCFTHVSATPLWSAAIEISDRYSENAYFINQDRAVPVASNQKAHEYLKEIATLFEINKSLNSHVAWHTFATAVDISVLDQ